jgi:hypothetical protein
MLGLNKNDFDYQLPSFLTARTIEVCDAKAKGGTRVGISSPRRCPLSKREQLSRSIPGCSGGMGPEDRRGWRASKATPCLLSNML